jgi:hypothetical protein
VISANDVAQLVRIEPPRQGGGADEVDEHDRELAAFRGVYRFRRHGSSRGFERGLARGSGPTDGCKNFPPVPERNADILEILSVRWGSTETSISFSANRCAYCS